MFPYLKKKRYQHALCIVSSPDPIRAYTSRYLRYTFRHIGLGTRLRYAAEMKDSRPIRPAQERIRGMRRRTKCA